MKMGLAAKSRLRVFLALLVLWPILPGLLMLGWLVDRCDHGFGREDSCVSLSEEEK